MTDHCFEYEGIKMTIYRDEAVIDTDGTLISDLCLLFCAMQYYYEHATLCTSLHGEVLFWVTEPSIKLNHKGHWPTISNLVFHFMSRRGHSDFDLQLVKKKSDQAN